MLARESEKRCLPWKASLTTCLTVLLAAVTAYIGVRRAGVSVPAPSLAASAPNAAMRGVRLVNQTTRVPNKPKGEFTVKTYLKLSAALLVVLLVIVVVVEALGVRILTDPSPWLEKGGLIAGAVGVGLLAFDVFLPVPSSFVMVAHGALYGVLIGSLLSFVGSLGAVWFGFALGRYGERYLARLVPANERTQVTRLLDRWGPVAIIITRPIPLVAEAVAVLAGTSNMRWTTVTWSAIVGLLPFILLQTFVGAGAAATGNVALVAGLALLLATVFWWVGRLWRSGHLKLE